MNNSLQNTLNTACANLVKIKQKIDELRKTETEYKDILVAVMKSHDLNKYVSNNHSFNVYKERKTKRLNTTIFKKVVQEKLKYTNEQMAELIEKSSGETITKSFIKISAIKNDPSK